MAQSTILAAGDTTADSSDVTVTAGNAVTFSLFSASDLPLSTNMTIYLKTPGATVSVIGSLTRQNPSYSIYSPGVYYVARTVNSNPGVNVGVSLDA